MCAYSFEVLLIIRICSLHRLLCDWHWIFLGQYSKWIAIKVYFGIFIRAQNSTFFRVKRLVGILFKFDYGLKSSLLQANTMWYIPNTNNCSHQVFEARCLLYQVVTQANVPFPSWASCYPPSSCFHACKQTHTRNDTIRFVLAFTVHNLNTLRHWDKMAAISQMTFTNAFSLIKTLNFIIRYDFAICSLRSNWQCGGIDSDNVLAPNSRQTIIWNNVGMLFWGIHASLGLNELIHRGRVMPVYQGIIGSRNDLSPVWCQAII